MTHISSIHPKLKLAREELEKRRAALSDLCVSRDQPIGLDGVGVGTKAVFVDLEAMAPQQASVIDCKTLRWESECPREVGALVPTSEKGMFFCPKCEENVHWASNKKERNRFEQLGKNVAFAIDRPLLSSTKKPAASSGDTYGLSLIRSILRDTTAIKIARIRHGKENEVVLSRLILKLKRLQAQIDSGVRDATTALRKSELDIMSLGCDIEQELALRHMVIGQNALQILGQLPQLEAKLSKEYLGDDEGLQDNQTSKTAVVLEFPVS